MSTSKTLEVTAYPCNRGEACGNIQFTGGRCRVCGAFAAESRFYRLADLHPDLQAEWHAMEAERVAQRSIAGRTHELADGGLYRKIPEPNTPEARILGLWNSFPCLRRKRVEKWDIAAIAEECRPWSTGERLCAAFVLSVWDPEYFTFDLHEALKKWDDDNRTAFLAWAAAPWWP